jgi:hypothetical protein
MVVAFAGFDDGELSGTMQMTQDDASQIAAVTTPDIGSSKLTDPGSGSGRNGFADTRRLWPPTLVLAAIVLMSSQVAIGATPSPGVKETCGAEIRSLCLRPWRLTPDSILSCVEENRSKLSPVCQAFWETAHRCQLEMKSVCGGLSPLTIKSCLANSGSKFSETCRKTLKLK